MRSRSTRAKGALRAVAASPADGMKWSQVSPGSQSPRTSSPLALFCYQSRCVREVAGSRRLVTSEKWPNEKYGSGFIAPAAVNVCVVCHFCVLAKYLKYLNNAAEDRRSFSVKLSRFSSGIAFSCKK